MKCEEVNVVFSTKTKTHVISTFSYNKNIFNSYVQESRDIFVSNMYLLFNDTDKHSELKEVPRLKIGSQIASQVWIGK